MNTSENQSPTKILLIDDEPSIAETVTAYAMKENIQVVYTDNGEDGLNRFNKDDFDLILVDWMLPGISGPEIVRFIRKKSQVPILMISARDDESDIVLGLELGADDYITKPFGPREMIARIHSLLRRSSSQKNLDDDVQNVGDLTISLRKGEILKNDEDIKLTPNEFRIFKMLLENQGAVVIREQLMEKALGYNDFLNDRTLDTHIKNLRKKIENDPKEPQIIVTMRELGFKMTEE